MINELSLQPFNKLNCMGMLNTLLPPQSPSGNSKLPSPLLSAAALKQERDSFFEYIRLVQKNGPKVLKEVMDVGKLPGELTGWDHVQKSVDKYLRVAKNTIDDCISTTGTNDFKPVEEPRKGKKTDSGVSFGSERRPSTANSTSEKPLPTMATDSKSNAKNFSTLERITREFKRMRVKTRPDVEEIVKMDKPAAAAQTSPATVPDNHGKKSMKKARSFANLGGLRSANASSASLIGSRKGSEADIPFDKEAMRRHRQLYEASTKASRS